MTFRQFVLPEYHEFIDSLGVGPEPLDGEDALVLRFEKSDEALEITLDIPGRSVRCRWTRDETELLEIFREGAIRVRPTQSGDLAVLSVDFETDGLRGELQLQLAPCFAVRDRLLFA